MCTQHRWFAVIISCLVGACACGDAPVVINDASVGTTPDASLVAAPPADSAGCVLTSGLVDAGSFDFPTVFSAPTPPPPLSGGTLLVTQDQHYAVVSDPDRDQIEVVDLAMQQLHATIALSAGDEPNRLVEDGAGNVDVILRRGGAMVTVAPGSGTVVHRVPVCASPRGIAYDAQADTLSVACADGTLVSLAPSTGSVISTEQIDADLRDIVVTTGGLFVSRFREAEVLSIAGGAVASRAPLPTMNRTEFTSSTASRTVPFVPDTAWRMVGLPSGGALVLHQRSEDAQLLLPGSSPGSSYYGPHFNDSCAPGVVQSAVSLVDGSGAVTAGTVFNSELALPIDLAVAADGTAALIVPAGLPPSAMPTVRVASLALLSSTRCETGNTIIGTDVPVGMVGRPVAATFVGPGHSRIAVELREPAVLVVVDIDDPSTTPQTISLASTSRADSGFDLFHSSMSGTVPCAGCHAEANDDGRVWQFACDDQRRTQTLRGGLLATAPFHWDGAMADFQALTNDAFTQRLGIASPAPDLSNALGQWLNGLPVLPYSTVADPAAVARGAQLFNDASLGCTTCHSGAHLTNNQNENVGTGGTFQVPSLLGVAQRAPYMHDGCAATLADRFGPCGGGDLHGHTSQLTSAQIADLVAYLGTL